MSIKSGNGEVCKLQYVNYSKKNLSVDFTKNEQQTQELTFYVYEAGESGVRDMGTQSGSHCTGQEKHLGWGGLAQRPAEHGGCRCEPRSTQNGRQRRKEGCREPIRNLEDDVIPSRLNTATAVDFHGNKLRGSQELGSKGSIGQHHRMGWEPRL